MGAIDKFEGMVEGVVEGSFSRLFKSKLSLAEIQKRLERAMEERREVAVGKSYVPNRYEVFLHPEDFSILIAEALPKADAERSLTEYVLNYARQRQFIFGGGRPRVWLSPSDQVRKRTIFIKAFTVDPNQARSAQAPVPSLSTESLAPELPLSEGTAVLNVGAMPLTGEYRTGHGVVARPEAALIVLEYPKNHPSKEIRFNKDVTIGRGLDNDIVFHDERRLSRHHARIEFKYGQFLLFDLNSTNGTLVNGQPVTQIVLTPGDRISLGGLEVLFQVF
ncbi:MAG TPA: DUF3662 and FHA domain-containing protein [Chloroflexia bacterium]|nr:DUF3662 and FHA domain-containing protein [Chloroflexia bacterium]